MILFDEKMRKTELFEIILKNAPASKKYCIYEILKQHGHDVIRLPPHHCDLNPIELAQAAVKRFIRVKNTTSDLNLQTLQTLTIEAIESVKQQK